ncbi:hypothetical protein ACP70R_013208 [Stipagrostis hirtigluma subsp. patula]
MAGRRSRRRRRRRANLDVEPAVGSPAKASSSSSGGSTDRVAQRKNPLSRLQQQPEEEDDDEAWTQSDKRAMRRDLLNLIHRRYYLDAISRLPPAALRATLARALLVGGHCFGPLHPAHNIILNSLWYAAAFPLPPPPTDDDSTADDVLLSTDGIARICHRSLDGLLASLRHFCPSLSTGDALCQLMYADADLAEAVALANGTSKSSALLVTAPRNLAAFHLAAQAAQHPNPVAFARFASSVVNAECSVVPLLLIRHVLSTQDIDHLSNVLVPVLPYEPPDSPLMLSPQALDLISCQKKKFKDSARQVLSVVNMALQQYTLQTGEQLILHSVCGVNLLDKSGLNNCYHINFLAYRKDCDSVVGAPVLFFTEATILTRDESDIHLCVLVDPATDIGCCFACEAKKKKIVHPTYDEYLGCREFVEEDEVDCGSNFPNPLDVDFVFFDADRDRAFASYLDESIGSGNISSPDV